MAKQKAIQYFREKQYEQHHHEIHAADRVHQEQSYLDSLKSHCHVDEVDDAGVHHHGVGEETYLDKLSEPKHATWGDYKSYVSELNQKNKPWKDLGGEVEGMFCVVITKCKSSNCGCRHFATKYTSDRGL